MRIEVLPVLWVFCGWVAVTAVYFLVRSFAGAAPAQAAASPYLSDRAADERLQQLSKSRFSGASLVYQAFVSGAGLALLYLFVMQGMPWAGMVFVPLALWMIYDSLSAPFVLRSMHPQFADAMEWIYAAAGGAVWAYSLVCVGLRLAGRAG